MTKLRADDPKNRPRFSERKVKLWYSEFKLKWEKKWKSLSICCSIYDFRIVWLYVSKFKEEKLHYHMSLFGRMSRALFSVDRAHVSKLYPVHSIFWMCFTKYTSGDEGPMSSG